MLEIIIVVRNFIIAVILSWVGISFTAPEDDTTDTPSTPEKSLPEQPSSFF